MIPYINFAPRNLINTNYKDKKVLNDKLKKIPIHLDQFNDDRK